VSFSIAIEKQPQISAAAAEVTKELANIGVVLINWEIAKAWDDSWGIFFRVLLTDQASKGRKLRDVYTRVVWRMSEKLDLPAIGLFPYFDFRSESEQAQHPEPAWR
jgi:hypothetical protein